MANLFNPEVETGNSASFLNYSKGVDVDTRGDSSQGKLFSGIGDMVSLATKAVSTAIDSEITTRVQSGVDQIRNEMGVDAATDTQEAPGKVTPVLLENGFRELDRNTKAMQAGALKDSHYWARLNSVARQLRSQFPGHREEIDQKISGMVGTTPANALIRSLQSEASEAASKASSEENRWQTFFNSNIGKGNVSAALAAAVTNKVVSREEFTRMMAEKEYREKNTDLSIKELNLRKQNNEAVEADGNRLMQKTIADGFSQHMMDHTTTLGQKSASLNRQINDINQGKLQLTPEVLQGLSVSFDEYERAANDIAGKYRLQFSGVANPAETEKSIKVFLDTIKEEKKALAEGNIALLARNRLTLEATKENGQLEVLKSEDLRRSAAISQTHGPQFVQLIMPQNSQNLTRQIMAATSYLSSGAVLGRSKSLVDSVAEVKAIMGQKDTAVDRAAVRNAARLITDSRSPADARANLINDFFNESNKRYLETVPNQDRPEIYSSMTSPAVEAKVLEMSKGQPELLQKYNSWVRHNSMVNSVRVLNKTSEFVAENNGYVSIVFNGKEFAAVPTNKPMKGPYEAVAKDNDEARSRFLVRDLNAYHNPLANIYEREGKGRDLAAYHLVNTVGLGKTLVPNALTTTKGDSGGGEDDSSQASSGESGPSNDTTNVFPRFTQNGKEVAEGVTVTNDVLDQDTLDSMKAEERGNGVPGEPPDFSKLSEEMDPAFSAIARERQRRLRINDDKRKGDPSAPSS